MNSLIDIQSITIPPTVSQTTRLSKMECALYNMRPTELAMLAVVVAVEQSIGEALGVISIRLEHAPAVGAAL